MSSFIDSTLLKFSQEPFVTGLLNGLGPTALFNASFNAIDIAVQSVTLGSLTPRSYKVPAFESIRSTGTDERIVPNTQRVRKELTLPRFGRLDWVDVAFEAVLQTTVQTLVAPLQSVTSQTLEQKLGGVASITDLRTKLTALYAPSVVDEIFARLRISTIEDFELHRHLFIELVGAAPPPFDATDPAATQAFTISPRVKIVDGFDVAGALQAAKLCRSILDYEATREPLEGVETATNYSFITLFDATAVTDTSLPGLTADQAKTAVRTLFTGERMFAEFIS